MVFFHRAAFFVCLAAFAQQSPPPPQPQAPPPQPAPQAPAQPEKAVTEMTTHDEQATFKSRVNLVMIPVVVRDGRGKPVAGLKKEDFQLFDRSKPQNISRFTAEKAGGQAIKFAEDADEVAKPAHKDAESVIPQRFMAYLFDDVHANFGNLAFARQAAIKHMSNDLTPSDRAAIFTTSGQGDVDFTDDKARLLEALNRLLPRPIGRSGGQQCPDISYYMADMIVNKNDSAALAAASADAMACMNLDPSMASTATQIAQGAAQMMLGIGEHETQVTYSVLKDVIRRMAATPGQRIVVLASPGFLTTDMMRSEESDIMDRAIRNNITINSLDIRGLYVDGADASQARTSRLKQQYDRFSARAEGDTLAELAYGTGGTFFENNNSMDEGFRVTGTAPETYYLLGFSPQNLKLDGTFHALKVTLKAPGHLDLQARKGYYAPKRLTDAAETAKQEIEEALFSREELRELPVDLHTQYFKAANGTANVTVMAHLDVKHFKFKKADGRNNNTVTIVSSLFDRNGSMVVAITKTLELHLKDDTLEKKVDGGLTLRTPFNVAPGTYLVRLVVRDSEGQMISAENSAVNAQ
ncbi:MAG: VWA domain-containing protein [Bryobacteraceae bacterium]|jgi:VWFA-related protein